MKQKNQEFPEELTLKEKKYSQEFIDKLHALTFLLHSLVEPEDKEGSSYIKKIIYNLLNYFEEELKDK